MTLVHARALYLLLRKSRTRSRTRVRMSSSLLSTTGLCLRIRLYSNYLGPVFTRREGNLQPVGARVTPVRGLPSTRIFLLFFTRRVYKTGLP